MQTVVTERGQISIPSEIRKRYKLIPNTSVEWLETPEGIFLIPVPKDTIKAFRGSGKGQNMSQLLLEERFKERTNERKKEK